MAHASAFDFVMLVPRRPERDIYMDIYYNVLIYQYLLPLLLLLPKKGQNPYWFSGAPEVSLAF